jgi:hypothetical protein
MRLILNVGPWYGYTDLFGAPGWRLRQPQSHSVLAPVN